jgi:hypothetical protein
MEKVDFCLFRLHVYSNIKSEQLQHVQSERRVLNRRENEGFHSNLTIIIRDSWNALLLFTT